MSNLPVTVEQDPPFFKRVHKIIVSSCLSGLTTVGIIHTFSLPLIPEIFLDGGAAIVMFGTSYFVLNYMFGSSKPKSKTMIQIKDKSAEKTLSDAEDKIRDIWLADAYPSFDKKLDEVTESIEDLIELLYEMPEAVFQSRDFLGYYLDAIITILDGYEKIIDPVEKAARAKEIDNTLDSIYNAVCKKIKSFEKKDTDSLDLDIKLLNDELKAKGF